MSQKSKKDEP